MVARGGQVWQLAGQEATVWRNGQSGFAVSCKEAEEQALEHLRNLDLVEIETEDTPVSRYRILIRCICCPVVFSRWERSISGYEKEILTWLRYAGLRLTAAELVFLRESGTIEEKKLLYEENRQALVEAIYTKDTIVDNLLEQQMESAECRDEVMNTLIKLLAKKKIVVL